MTQKKQDEGFTLIELLVVIIIIGILSAIALPSFLNQANKAKQSEAKTYVGSMNRSQQAYYLENGNFAGQSEFAELGLGIKTATENYVYGITGGGDPSDKVANFADPNDGTGQADGDKAAIKAYHGIVSLGETDQQETTTLAVLCEAKKVTRFQGQLGSAVNPDGSVDPATGVPECEDTEWKDLSN
ncbi:MAG: prepilin-type N-terminal cleavage/methylation domain-containing protein [Moorea sp. SIO3B2]|nr:prepilin-type N-terminal cleavage/methylation domain-containing protein [Moorena sp. SIO3B2]